MFDLAFSFVVTILILSFFLDIVIHIASASCTCYFIKISWLTRRPAKTEAKPPAKSKPGGAASSGGASSSGIEFAETQECKNGWKILKILKSDGHYYNVWVNPLGKRHLVKHAAKDDGFKEDDE